MKRPRVSSVLNIRASLVEVEALCLRNRIPISALEELPDGGVRIVPLHSRHGLFLRRIFRSRLLPDEARRFPLWAESWY